MIIDQKRSGTVALQKAFLHKIVDGICVWYMSDINVEFVCTMGFKEVCRDGC